MDFTETDMEPGKIEPAAAEINQLIALFNARRYDEMEQQAQLLADKFPASSTAWKMLGTALQTLGKMSIHVFQKVVELSPGDAEAYYNLGIAQQSRNKFKEAAASYRRAVAINPNYGEAYGNLGNTLKTLGQLEEAARCCREALRIMPNSAETLNNLGTILKTQGKYDEAQTCFRRAIALQPGNAIAYFNLGNILMERGVLEEAAGCYYRATKIKPDLLNAHHMLGQVFEKLGRLGDAIVSYCQVINIDQKYAEAHHFLGNAMRKLGHMDEAVDSYWKAMSFKPGYSEAYSSLLFLFACHLHVSPEAYLYHARDWERTCLGEIERRAVRRKAFRNLPKAGRRLRLGYLLPDDGGEGALPIPLSLLAQHDRSQVELFIYPTSSRTDRYKSFKDRVEHWLPLVGIPQDMIAKRIESDCIDVLVDLSGHGKGNHQAVFARRAAPVQVHFGDYSASTGQSQMDYWLGDDYLTPADMDSHFTEQVWRLQRSRNYFQAPSVMSFSEWKPDIQGSVWFGNFDEPDKLNSTTLALWGRLLQAVPEGKLLFAPPLIEPFYWQHIVEVMAGHGVTADRLEFVEASKTDIRKVRARMDIVLDPVGVLGGGMAVADALYAGIPVIAMAGDRVPLRFTASVLHAAECPQWIAGSEENYIDLAASLAREVELRQELRSGLSELLAGSPLCDARGMVSALEDAYATMFKKWIEKRNSSLPMPFAVTREAKRFMVIRAWGAGFWSDMHHVLGQLAIAELGNIVPVVFWGEESRYTTDPARNGWNDYFEPVSDYSVEDMMKPGYSYFPPKWTLDNFRLKTNCKASGAYCRVNCIEFLDRTEDVCVGDFYTFITSIQECVKGSGHRFESMTGEEIYRDVHARYIRLHPDIQAEIDQFVAGHFPAGPMIAVHYRHKSEGKMTEAGGNVFFLENYFDDLDALLRREPEANIYLCTDNEEATQEFRKRYGAKIICREVERVRKGESEEIFFTGENFYQQARDVILDVYIAGRCDYFIGDGTSNVSCAICHIKEWGDKIKLFDKNLITASTYRFLNCYLAESLF